jgi:predicted lipoprotein with Yx(FWY)xxD motif
MRNRWWAAPVLAGTAALIAACGSSGSTTTGSTSPVPGPSVTQQGTSPASSAAVIKTGSTSQGTVVVNAQGGTLYWFAIDTPMASHCTGSCASYWHPVLGKPTLAPGASLSGTLGTITRSGGQLQATYDGHPLYTYVGDSGPGQLTGNGSNASGGLWWAMTPTGAKLGASAPSSGSSSSPSGGGYGY